jgi:hypothetical protein
VAVYRLKMNHHRHKEGVHTTIQGRRSSVHTAEIRQVQNVALADATAKAGVSPWTKAMFKLYLCLFIATLNSCINGYDGSLMGAINEYEQYRTYFGYGHRIRHLHYRELGWIVCRRASNRFPRQEMGHVHRLQHHHDWYLCPSNLYQPRRVHGRSLRPRIRSRHHIDRGTRIRERNGASCLSRRVYGRFQHILVRRRHSRQFCAFWNAEHCGIAVLAYSAMVADGVCGDSACLLAIPA